MGYKLFQIKWRIFLSKSKVLFWYFETQKKKQKRIINSNDFYKSNWLTKMFLKIKDKYAFWFIHWHYPLLYNFSRTEETGPNFKCCQTVDLCLTISDRLNKMLDKYIDNTGVNQQRIKLSDDLKFIIFY